MSYPKAFYTMTMTEFSALWHETQEYADFVTEMNADFAGQELSSDVATMYRNAVFNRWHEYETAGETIHEQADYLMSTYREHSHYHIEQLKLYLSKMADGPTLVEMLTRTVTSDSETSGSESKTTSEERATEGTNSREGSNESIHVDLPNKQIDANDIYKYPSDGDKGSDTVENTYNESTTNDITDSKTTSGTSDNTTTYEDPAKFFDLYQKALRACRNIFMEQADDYSECFIHIF